MLFYLLIEAFFTYRTMNNIENPWNVENLEEFLYFCCPECDLKDQSKMQFLQHALNQHPNAKGSVQKFIIKEETFEDSEEFPYLNDINFSEEYDNPIEDYNELLKCEIKEEPTDHNNEELMNVDKEEEFSDNSDGLKNLSCEYCGKAFKKNQKLRIHIESIHEGKRYNCEFCDKSFTHVGTLQMHRKTNHGDKIMRSDHELNLETWKKNEEVLKNLVEKSDLNKYSRNTLNRSIAWEAITDKYNLETGNEMDSKAVAKKWQYYQYKLKLAGEKKHTESVNENSNNEKCDICSKVFPDTDKLANHRKRYHPKKIKRQCHICSETFTLKFDFENHYKDVHGIFNMYQCELCPNKKYDKREMLTRHIHNAHKNNHSVVCDLCGKSYSNPRALHKHHRSVHEKIKDHICNFCSRAFSESNDLKNHIKCVHEGVKDIICDLCGQAFGLRTSLVKHIKTVHEGIRDNICKTCGKAFSTLGHLNEHIRTIHEGIKRHKCTLCDRRFPKPSKLKIHMKSAHRNVTNVESDIT